MFRRRRRLEISLREIHVQFDRYLIFLHPRYLEPVPILKQRAADALAEAEAAAGTPQEQMLMKRVRQGYKHFFDEYDRLAAERPPQGEYAKVLELIDTVLMKEILEPTREYLRLNEGVLQAYDRGEPATARSA